MGGVRIGFGPGGVVVWQPSTGELVREHQEGNEMATTGSAEARLGASVPDSGAAVPATKDTARHAGLVRVTHWITTLCFLALLVTGIEITISHPRFYWGETGNVLTTPLFQLPIPSSRALVQTGYGYVMPDQNGWSRYLHFEAAWLMVLTGLLYVIWGFSADTFGETCCRAAAELSWRVLRREIVNHLRFKRPSEAEAWSYNTLQRLSYLFVIFVLFPLVIWTGLAMSPGFDSAFPAAVTSLGGRQSARTIHFFVSIALVLFLVAHVVMIFLAGFKSRMGAMITGRMATGGWRADGAHMSDLSRRKLIIGGACRRCGIRGAGSGGAAGGKIWTGAAGSRRNLRIGETLTYASQRLLTRHSMAREFSRSQISKRPLMNELAPLGDDFKRLEAGKFADWRLTVDGLVDRPAAFSLDQIKSYPSRNQITEVVCEEGWSYVAEWHGVPLSHVLDLAGVQPHARYVVYFSIQPLTGGGNGGVGGTGGHAAR